MGGGREGGERARARARARERERERERVRREGREGGEVSEKNGQEIGGGWEMTGRGGEEQSYRKPNLVRETKEVGGRVREGGGGEGGTAEGRKDRQRKTRLTD